MAKLINGNGNPAIYAAEDADLIASLAGNVTCIANVGNKYAATEEDATTIRLDDGVIITKEGRRIQLEAGESDTFYIPTGTSGQTNYYIIGYKLVQNPDSTQVAEQFVQKMNSSSETITEDTFRSGATEVYVSLYRVTQVDFTIDSVDALLPELSSSNRLADELDITNIGQWLGTAAADSWETQAWHDVGHNLVLSAGSYVVDMFVRKTSNDAGDHFKFFGFTSGSGISEGEFIDVPSGLTRMCLTRTIVVDTPDASLRPTYSKTIKGCIFGNGSFYTTLRAVRIRSVKDMTY